MYVWTDGLDTGTFAGVQVDRYQKDLPLQIAFSREVLVAYEMNNAPLTKERGGPVRLVVPGWFATNSTKWLCRISIQRSRAKGPFTTKFYNEIRPNGNGQMPVWRVGVNSMITSPAPGSVLPAGEVKVEGWSWSCDGVGRVEVREDDGEWQDARVEKRVEYGWQGFEATLDLQPGRQAVVARAICSSGENQPLNGWRNHVHRVEVVIQDD
jgi:DMSO/TMAO reductase YedYZ molybdopterin-dependent catalytic subunit